MSYVATNALSPPFLLEPLEGIPLEPAFPDFPPFPSVPGLSYLGLFDDTPSTIENNLPSPVRPVNAAAVEVHEPTPPFANDVLLLGDRPDAVPPPALLLKDYDSFSDGSAPGSFNLGLPSERDSVAFSPTNPARSIEVWRQDVFRCLEPSRARARSDDPEEPAAKRPRVAADTSSPAADPFRRPSSAPPCLA